ncbi:MAG: sigma-70 family RNA polymerase sigma factor [Gemmataceae bacterium]
MYEPVASPTRRVHRTAGLPGYVYHPDFAGRGAARAFDPAGLIDRPASYDRYMPDEVTREHTKRMHYAAYRMHKARTAADVAAWQDRYHRLRDLVVIGNRKLVYRAVRRRMAVSNLADDLIGDCHIVLIQAVAAFNPWLGIRFSTYAYTCLVRALARQAQRLSTDRLARSLSLTALPDGEPAPRIASESSSTGSLRLDLFLRAEHPLLSAREKAIISRRFCFDDAPAGSTLETVGRAVGLSKERVRQVQASALSKLRKALTNQSLALA